jgi:hypothetical protein
MESLTVNMLTIRTRTYGGEAMKKLNLVKLEKRIAPRYMPFAS